MTKYENIDAVLDAIWDAAVEFSGPIKPEVNSVGEAVRLLVEAGANVNVRMEHGCTPLHEAVSAGEFEIARYLLRVGADQSIRDDDGKLPRDKCWDGEWDGIFGARSA